MSIVPKQWVYKFTAASRGLHCYCTPIVLIKAWFRPDDILLRKCVKGLYQHRQSKDATRCWSVHAILIITVMYTITSLYAPTTAFLLATTPLDATKKWTCSFSVVVESKLNRSRIAIVIAALVARKHIRTILHSSRCTSRLATKSVKAWKEKIKESNTICCWKSQQRWQQRSFWL